MISGSGVIFTGSYRVERYAIEQRLLPKAGGADNDSRKRTSGSPSSTASSKPFWLLRSSSNLVQLRHQLGPSEGNARRVRDVIFLLEEYGGMA